MIYGIGASWNPEMSQYNRALKRGLADVKGLSFAYRLNTWGPKNGPAMRPANTFPGGYTPAVRGLAGPLTWMEGILGIEAPADILTDATNILSDVNTQLTGAGTTITSLLNQAQGYDNVAAADVQSKAQACEAEAAGLQANLANLQTSSQNIATFITTLSGTTDKNAAQAVKDAANNLSAQVSTFMKGISQLQSDVAALVKYAQSGPGAVQTLENAAVGSISTLTWVIGGSLAAYFLLPTFIPRLASGLRKSRSS
jgi:hypothetical protein